jgi:hypothetical protein
MMNDILRRLAQSMPVLAVLAAGVAPRAVADTDYERALKRAQYILNNTVPTDAQLKTDATSVDAYRAAVRRFVEGDNFYDALMRYHERLFGTGLQTDYLDELQNDNIDDKTNKFAQIDCHRADTNDHRFRCFWASEEDSNSGSCPQSWEQAVSVFWYPGIVAWVCPSIQRACGADLSRCFIRYDNEDEARNAELGATEIFDSRFAVVKSFSKQAAGIATAVAVANYPYTKILEPGLTAVDGAIAHFYRQTHHFDISKLNPPAELVAALDAMSLADTKFQLVYTGSSYEQAGVLTTFGWLRRYEKNRTRANQLYERLLCRKFTSELPRVFPADPGNLRETPGCSGCHATLDPLADFFKAWGEGGELYLGQQAPVTTSFGGQSGSYVSELADIIRNDNAFSTCQVENVWTYLMGRKVYRDEADLRAALTSYFVTTGYSLRELFYAVATHPAFTEGARADAVVGDPLEQPPLGEPPGGNTEQPCDDTIDFTADIEPDLDQCTTCHNASSGSRQDLSTSAQWEQFGPQAVVMMASGNMPPGQAGPPQIGAVYDLKEKVRCWLEQNQ